MKKFFSVLAVALLIGGSAQAQNVQQEALESLTTAQQFVTAGNYSKAIEEINYALAKINELTAEELLNYIPEPPDGYTLVNKQSQGVGAAAAMVGNAGASAQYSNQAGATLDLNISIGGMTGKMAGFAALGSMFAALGQDSSAGQSRQVRVQGYTGTETFNAAGKTGNLAFQVGEKTSVTIEATGIDSAEVLMKLAGKIDMAGIAKNF